MNKFKDKCAEYDGWWKAQQAVVIQNIQIIRKNMLQAANIKSANPNTKSTHPSNTNPNKPEGTK